jgi:hypothetical protein
MMALSLALALSGWLMTAGGDKETVEDFHELLANGFLVLVALHIAGVLLHTLRHGELLARAMLDGRKSAVPDKEAIGTGRAAAGAMFVALVAGFALTLWTNFDADRQVLRVFGSAVQLGEADFEEHLRTDNRHSEDDDHD